MLLNIPKLLIAGSLCTMLCGCGGPMEFKKKEYHGVYRNPEYAVGFKLDEGSKDWEIREGVPNALVVCLSPLESPSDNWRESMVINVAPDSFSEALQQLEGQMPGFKQVDRQETKSPPSLTFTYVKDSQTLKARTYFVKTDKANLSLTFTSTEKDFPRWNARFETMQAGIKTRLADLPETPIPSASPSAGVTDSPSPTPGTPTPTASAASSTPSASGSPGSPSPK